MDFQRFLILLVEMETQGWRCELESLVCTRAPCRERGRPKHYHICLRLSLRGIHPRLSLTQALATHLRANCTAACDYADTHVMWTDIIDICEGIDILHSSEVILTRARTDILHALGLRQGEIDELLHDPMFRL